MRRAECQKEKSASAISPALKPNALSLEWHKQMIANKGCFRSGGLQTAIGVEPRIDGSPKCAATDSTSRFRVTVQRLAFGFHRGVDALHQFRADTLRALLDVFIRHVRFH